MKQSVLALAILFLLCAPISCGSDKDIVGTEEPQRQTSVSYETTFANTDISTSTTVKAADISDTVYSEVTAADTVAQNVPVQTQSEAAVPTSATGFKRGKTYGSVYISEYAGFSFNGMDTIEYMADDDIYMETHMAGRFMSQEDREKIDTIIVDACGIYDEYNSRVSFSFIDTKARFPEKSDVTIEDIVPTKEFDGSEWITLDVTEPVSVDICGREYRKIRVSNGYSDHVEYHYISKIDDVYTLDIRYSAKAQDDTSEFESRFNALA
ncbi:MAG: hypothetical protein K6G33_11270 [Ruminococcus sp.]|uniref:hypothetical protein n=1 Tax=Ruminococcus sp. TaxID=41978 RepID=UPI0025FD8E26|nr:hypothetical protein [Ruminococcus sp.]MCR5601304.1 hypothetical protein [Ruminococcus sp.]